MLLVLGTTLGGAELTGFISDAACGWNNARNNPEARECAVKCVKAGWDPVFIRDGDMNAYKISNKAKVMSFVGDQVVINGSLTKADVIVRTIRKVSPRR
ncbi:MAG: hypothetical protein H7039_23710 [Bryobacteraceae bacterium]|nr:hypothetical protein [Bryobacteraceae bacterium]